MYTCEARSMVCQCWPQVEMAALRDIARTALMDAASTKFQVGAFGGTGRVYSIAPSNFTRAPQSVLVAVL